MRTFKVIIDTNLWISYLISDNFKELDAFIETKKVSLILSSELVKEFVEVVERPKFKKYFTKRDIEKVFNFFELQGELINVTSNSKLCRDSKDNFLLNLSIDSKADFLITGDQNLLVLKKINSTKIVTFKEFLLLVKTL